MDSSTRVHKQVHFQAVRIDDDNSNNNHNNDNNVCVHFCRMPFHFCPQCGTKLQPLFKFCPTCGEKIPSLADGSGPEDLPASLSPPLPTGDKVTAYAVKTNPAPGISCDPTENTG